MEKISPPLRIALVAVMLLAVAWFVVLRPKPAADESAAPPPGIGGLSNDVKRAQSATATANAAAAAAQNSAASVDGAQATAPSAAPAPSTATATKTSTTSATATTAKGATVTATKTKTTKAVATKPAAKPKEQPTVAAEPKAKTPAKPEVAADPAAPLVAALKQNKAVVLLFRSSSSDSQAVADAVRAVPKQVRRVVVRVAPISQVGRYATFTEKTPIAQAPTVLVIGPGRRAKVIVGYTSTAEVAEAVGDLRRAARR